MGACSAALAYERSESAFTSHAALQHYPTRPTPIARVTLDTELLQHSVLRIHTAIRMFQNLRALLQPPAGLDIDFQHPPGAAALVPADGVSWRMFANPVTLFIGGVTAVLLELAHPAVRTGVWEHSSFRTDPLGRLRRTGFAAMVTIYAPQDAGRAMIAQVVRLHDKVQGSTPGGLPYRANDPELLRWVQATAVFGFSEAYHRFAQPLTAAEQSQAFAEGQTSARLYGAVDAPASRSDWEQLLQSTAPQLEQHPILAEFLHIMEQAPLLPKPLRPLQRLLLCAAVHITPQPVRALSQLQPYRLNKAGLWLLRLLARIAHWIPLPQWPPRLAAKRMGVKV